ncbi:hypothetical protein BTM_4058 [Burkholderia thailandensis 34]|nr:hypothetical protein BTM_6144 [Burkholderia thailandensis 34]AJY27801.1 hypothetical protein BTM_432 [Burkholderia thailandensis 34]AJY29690.1 hypothetical protein BTM_1590 [Burkholderia thailandensis 34]AJY29957.1 hypothetical protein BTM_1826 [Burkholderia thailandensis 34]AJY32026.1 hypothetical protein BTM_4058 [Burkholderia thailandensis 34]
MHVCVPFVANLEPSECMKPGKGTFDEPARFTEATAVRRTDFGKQGRDAAFAQTLSVRLGTVAPVALNNLRFAQRTSAFSSDGRNRLNQRIELRDVVAIRGSQDDRQRDTLRVDDEVVLTAELAPVRWVRAGFFPASIARTEELSTIARAMSSWPRRRNSASSASWMRCQTPASCHATSRRQHAVPEPQPISCGSRFQAMPERSTNTMPVSTARSGVGLRPAYRRFRGARFGSRGSMSDHSSSSISSLGIASWQAKQVRKLTPSRKS